MAAPALLLVVLLALPTGGVGELRPAADPYQVRLGFVLPVDTAKRPALVPDTVKALPAVVALVPDEDEKLTRKSALSIGAAIAVLSLITLLLYNVRSR